MNSCNVKDFKQIRARAYSQDEDAGSFTVGRRVSPCKLGCFLMVKPDWWLPLGARDREAVLGQCPRIQQCCASPSWHQCCCPAKPCCCCRTEPGNTDRASCVQLTNPASRHAYWEWCSGGCKCWCSSTQGCVSPVCSATAPASQPGLT